MLCSPHSIIWFPTLVLQQVSFVMSYEDSEQNAKESRYLNSWSFQDVTF